MKNKTGLLSIAKKKFFLFASLIIQAFSQNKVFAKILFIFSGIGATIWFLSRVIPKPSRAYYPCMQAAAPLMAGFVVYLLSITGSVMVFKKIRTSLFSGRYLLATVLTFVLLVLVGVSIVSYSPPTSAKSYAAADDIAPNQPMGVGQGVNPGRVVWVWDNQVVNQNCQQTVNKNGLLDDGDDLWFMDKNTNQGFVDYMLSKSVQRLTGKSTDQQAWDALFRYFNNKKGLGDNGYKPGEIIFIKTNHGSAWGTDRFDSQFRFNDKAWNAGYTETGPQLVLAVLRHLVSKVGVPQQNIFVGDPMKNIYKEYYQKWHTEFPDVKYLGNDLIMSNIPGLQSHGRTPVVRTADNVLLFSSTTDIQNTNHMKKLYTIFQDTDYLINLSALKPHDVGGITAMAKNHFGSHASNTAGHLHDVLVANRPQYGLYRVLVDMMGHMLLGQNTMLNVLDVMWSSENTELSLPCKWTMYPFNNKYPASLLVSQDQVAIESVAFDFLRTEYTVGDYDKNNPNMAGTDDYLHQAADEANWPTGVIYNPDGTGKIGSLGVHEHWNNPTDMKYSVNLGTGSGIELVKVWVEGNHIPLATAPIPNKTIAQTNVDVIIIQDVNPFFHDADGDLLSFTIQSNNARLTCQLDGNNLVVRLGSIPDETEEIKVTLTAHDGKAENSLSFMLKYDPATAIQHPQLLPGQVKIYPNPAQDYLNVEIKKAGNYTLYLFNSLGQIEWEQNFEGAGQSISLKGKKSGIYRVVIYENNQIVYNGGLLKE